MYRIATTSPGGTIESLVYIDYGSDVHYIDECSNHEDNSIIASFLYWFCRLVEIPSDVSSIKEKMD